MRKLAREAVIFVLLTPVLVFGSSFAYLYYDAHKPITSDMTQGVPSGLISERISTPTSELLGLALLFGLYGFPVGFGVWVFYRTVRFAIKG